MNLFVLDRNPWRAAMQHCDQHSIKMIVEYAQMLSTAHLLLDGKPVLDRMLKSGKPKYKFVHPSDHILYKKTHENHPSSIWVRSSNLSYDYTYQLFKQLSHNYSVATGKIHKTWDILGDPLEHAPANIKHVEILDAPPLCMPDEFKFKQQHQDDWESTIKSYQNLYCKSKSRFATFGKYKNPQPEWYYNGSTESEVL